MSDDSLSRSGPSRQRTGPAGPERTPLERLLGRLTAAGGIDLHLHSTASDGSLTPLELARKADQNRLSHFALTDHDTIAGVLTLISQRPQHAESSSGHAVLIPAVELSVMLGFQTVHLLAYYSGREIERLQPFLSQRLRERSERNERLIRRLRELNFPISMADLEADAENQAAGRVKAAQWLVANGYAGSINEAFQRWLADGKPGFVPHARVEFGDALGLIRSTGGFAVIAHPHEYGWCESGRLLQNKLSEALDCGRVGIEAYHSDATWEQQNLILDTARKLDLTVTAGSDFHGTNKEAHAMYDRTSSPQNHYSKI